MPDAPYRRSPIDAWLAARQPEWHTAGNWRIAARMQDAQIEQAAAKTLALCDLTGPEKFGVKGRNAGTWLAEQGVDVPPEIYQSRGLDDGGVAVRLGRDEFLLESGLRCETVPELATRFRSAVRRLFRVEHQEATFLLVGSRANEVLAQTSGVNFRQVQEGKLVFTRVAGVSCGILPSTIHNVFAHRLWVDPSYALYLWEVLVTIVEELDGQVIGAAALFPELR